MRHAVVASLARTLGVTLMPRDLVHRAAFESHGETHTRLLAQQGGEVGAEATAWLREQQALREDAAATKRDAREERTLSMAAEALSIAKEANRIASEDLEAARASAASAARQALWARWAAIIATVAAIIAVSTQIHELIALLHQRNVSMTLRHHSL